jgi:hypothetical protein
MHLLKRVSSDENLGLAKHRRIDFDELILPFIIGLNRHRLLEPSYFSTAQMLRNATGLPWFCKKRPSFSGPSGL